MHRPETYKNRAVIRLSASVEKKLIGYVAAASAAGAWMLACSAPAEARVVSTLSWTQISPRTKVSLDLNNDGVADFQLSNIIYSTSVHGFQFGSLKVLPQNQPNLVWGTGTSASALGSGVTVGPNKKFKFGHAFMGKARYYCYSGCSYHSTGQWTEATRLYLGFKFSVHGEIHYGWARLNVAATNGGMFAAVTKYAYETVPNKPIVTGEGGGEKGRPQRRRSGPGSLEPAPSLPGSLGGLATGSSLVRRALGASLD